MSRSLAYLFVAPVVAAASLSVATAQTPPTAERLTVEGCVTKDDRADRSTAASQFVLTDQRAPTPPAASGGASSGAMVSGQTTAKKAYALRSDAATVDLQAHVGKMVRVVGTSTAPSISEPLAGRSPEATPHPPAAGTPGSTGSMFDTANLPTLVVASIATIAGTCR